MIYFFFSLYAIDNSSLDSFTIFILLSIFVTDLISRIVQVLKRDLYWVKVSAQEAGLIKLVKLWDKG